MLYSEFNNKVFDFYCLRSKANFITLSIDINEFEEILNVADISNFSELKLSWNKLLIESSGIPQYFGLLAVQNLAASLMQNDLENSRNAYQIRFCELIGIESTSILQSLFRGDDPLNPIQEQVWEHAKLFLFNSLNLELIIPKGSKHTWRFVKYPISQSLFNSEDLKYFTSFFAENFYYKEFVPYELFKTRLSEQITSLKMTQKMIETLFDLKKEELCYKQVYNYYLTWDGVVYNIEKQKKKVDNKGKFYLTPKLKVLLTFQDDIPSFYTLDKNEDIVDKVSKLNDLFSRQQLYNISINFIFFNEIEGYIDEYISSSFIESNSMFILTNKKAPISQVSFLELNNEKFYKVDSSYVLYKIKMKELLLDNYFRKYIQKINPIRLIGGIKTSRRNQYLFQYGPNIIAEQNYKVLFANSAIEYSPSNNQVGVYKIRSENYADIEFELCNSNEENTIILSKGKGWNIKSYKIDTEFHIEGCLINSCISNYIDEIRIWINTNLERNSEFKNRSFVNKLKDERI